MLKKIMDYLPKQAPIIPTSLDDTTYPYLAYYHSNYAVIDNYFVKKYGTLALDDMLEGSTDVITLSNVESMIIGTIKSHNEQLKRIYAVESLEYDPIYNVEESYTRTNTFGEQVRTDVIGARTSDNTTDAYNQTSLNETTGYDANTLQTDNKTTNAMPETHSSVTTESATDTSTDAEHTDTETYNRQGNIGIMSSQELILKQLNTWEYYNFYDYLFKLVFSVVTLPIYTDL